MRIKSIVILLLFAGLIGLAFYTAMDEKEEQQTEVKEEENTGLKRGSKAPTFSLRTLDGKQVDLNDYRGKKVIINFWATWCPPCRDEMPEMEKFYNEYRNKDIEILAVNLEYSETNTEKVRKFVQEYKLSFPIPLDEKNTIGKQFRAVSIPTSYFIDEKGVISNSHIGPMDYDFMKNEIDKMNR
ncbi:TlpA disulfide reductase family protein [Fictibacillus phosphorivorans]|uniref:TlpA disulfide reductase family protein n=1 Tax=Fictibacillus phosphorivorans TaxID=1221500 RepID=UPI001D1776CD|nr:TlpA family protein disulfide reductase [Fictibacillus phosphorivorans]